ncbi:MAG: heavy metal translocating P-type ATPase [Bifidobacteriaceae bacterium]|jgi:Cd2+/Zn2+-exporting ATPase|nr:heavy metal translocating P-type ATPase [Bifidobacteriaceae bacterium]MCI1979650.1 heavy metal translocating P-type ATPase [Bifidobacteriaceae bacterium]
MLTIQQFFTRHRRSIVIAMTVFVAAAMVAQYALAWSTVAGVFYAVVGIVGLIPLVIKAINSLKFKVVSIELLVSVAILGALIIAEFSEAGIVAWLFLLGEVIEDATLSKTRSAIKELTELAPQTALRLASPTERTPEEVDVDDIDEGDYLLVKTGSQVPVDGRIVFGSGRLDEASVTGEPLPHHKSADTNDDVFAGTMLTDGTMVVQATKVGEDTVFGKILELVEQAEDSKTSAQRFIDRFAKYYTPVVLLLALVVGLVTLNVRLAITLLVLGCPGALVIGVPVSNVAGIGLGARHGILAKGAQILQTLSEVDTVVFDKTGTLTTGRPSVVHAEEVPDPTHTGGDDDGPASTAANTSITSITENHPDIPLWRLVASAERESSHPLATAMVDFAATSLRIEMDSLPVVAETHVVAGKGIIAAVDGHTMAIGNAALMTSENVRGITARTTLPQWEKEGLSTVFVSVDGILRLVAGLGDTVRPGAVAAIARLRERGIKHLIMLSGDGEATATAISSQLGLDEAHGDMLPQDKADFITKLQDRGQKVAFVGDGINDSPALVASDLGIAMGNGTATAVDISDVVLLNSDISKLPTAYSIARATVANTRENIGIAVATVAFLFIGLFAGFIYMASGMLAHEASILVVVVNALRLLSKKLDADQV